MTKEEYKMLFKYLYSSNELVDFMFNDFYIELSTELPFEICVNKKNRIRSTRVKNLFLAKSIIVKFLKKHPEYKDRLNCLLGSSINLINELLVGYLLYYLIEKNIIFDFDIFKDEQSVCYSEFSLVDILKSITDGKSA